jgi:hypothetical protein
VVVIITIMFTVLVKYIDDTLHKVTYSSNDRFARTSMRNDDGHFVTYFQVQKLGKRILLECGFSKQSMNELITAGCTVKLELMQAEMRLKNYTDIPMTMLTIPGGSGFVRFDVTDFDEIKTRALADHMLQWYPRELIRDWDLKRRLALGMALHPRLGNESALGRMGSDALELVVKYDIPGRAV